MDIYLILGLLGIAIVIAFIVLLLTLRSRPQRGSEGLQPPLPSVSHAPNTDSDLIEKTGAELVALEGEAANRSWEILASRKGLTIGRDSANDIALPEDMMVSRQHAQIVFEDGQCVLYDRDSVNGVFVNDRRVMRRTLRRGDVIRICNTTFRFEAQGDVGAPAEEKPAPVAAPDIDSMRLSHNSNFEGFVLEGKVGQGGMSVVYKASDPQQRPVAIKVLDVDDDYIVKKFIQEGEIGRTLRNHPNICRIYGSGRAEDHRFYLVMEYIPGVSLREYVGEPMTEEQIVHIMGQACDALHYAHLQNVVHRDIKPENIMVEDHGLVKVTDFGIAKLTSSVTVTKDRTVGTPEYISPEQAQAQRVVPASDIYSLGVVLYELLTGRPPFPMRKEVSPRVATISVLVQHIHAAPSPPSQVNPRISPRLAEIALQALAKAPERRFGSAWEMACAMGYERRAVSTPPPNIFDGALVVMDGPRRGHRLRLTAPSITLGRTQIAPDDPYISKRHFKIVQRGNQLWLEDQSRNGTWVNGERVFGEVPISAKDVISVGKHNLRIEIGS
ncbi:MAG: protein kinase [Chloroflexi bacterium]|jgi:serine/threonine protein kinase|nr:protein kinase [Chloroflexota bacterium]